MTDEARLGRLERQQAVSDQRLASLEARVGDLTPVATAAVRLEGAVNGLKDDVAEIKGSIQARGEQDRSLRIALIGLSGTILVTLIGAIVAVLASSGHA